MPAALYYIHDPFAPKPNRPSRFGSAVVINAKGRILLEHRKDSFRWGIVSGDIRDTETFQTCALRRTIEETGIHLKYEDLHLLKLFDDPSRIVSFHEGNIYRIVHLAYYAELKEIPETVCGDTSIELQWVDPGDLKDYEIIVTHQDILETYFKERHICYAMNKTFREN